MASTDLELDLMTRLTWRFKYSDTDLGDSSDNNFGPKAAANYFRQFTNGDGDDEVNQIFVDYRFVSLTSGTDDIDLVGVLTNRWGETISFQEIKVLMICNLGVSDSGSRVETAGEDLLIGGAGSVGKAWATFLNGNQDAVIRLRSGGILVLSAPNDGYSISTGTQDVLRIAHGGSVASGGAIDYFIGIAGVQ